MTRRRERGFSALEALIAVAILAVALLALISLQIQISRTYTRHRDLRETADAQQNALALLRDINPTERPHGEMELGPEMRVSWQARALTTPTRTTRRGQGEGDFEVTLYQIDVVVVGNNQRVSTFSVDQVGWRRIANSAE